jgi:hypothetical protein
MPGRPQLRYRTGTGLAYPAAASSPEFPDATNTGIAGVGLTEAGLTAYTGPGGYAGGGTFLVQNQLINDDIRIFDTVQITLRKCKINGHVDADSATASITLEDCHIDASTWTNAATGFQNMTITRCDIEGGITAVNGSVNVTVTDSYLHGQVISPTGSDHAGGFLCSGGSNILLSHCTIWCSVVDNGFGGGPSNNLQFFGDFGTLTDLTVDRCYFPATAGGYSVSLGHNPGKPGGDDPTRITFTNNVLARSPAAPGGKGGSFGTVTSFLAANGNVYSNNVWYDDRSTQVPVNA